mmetsp:Transcript_31088/g.49769  ORF Transcript_31088/g.49769 Transcript_31088/m.49769 type:complete len:359 (-) Transcript_31088:1395-2471(-)
MLNYQTAESFLRRREPGHDDASASARQHKHHRQRNSLSRGHGKNGKDGEQMARKDGAHGFSEKIRLGRVLRDSLRNPGAGVSCKIVGGTVDEAYNDKHVEYDISSSFVVKNHSRRYTEFRELDAVLRGKFPNLRLPNLPENSGRFRLFYRRSFDPGYVESKSKLLNIYLEELCQIPVVRKSPEFLRFIFCPKEKLKSDAKKIFQATGGEGESPAEQERRKSFSNPVSPYDRWADSPAEECELIERPSGTPETHPLIKRLILRNRRHKVSLIGCTSLASISLFKFLVVYFVDLDADVNMSPFTLNGGTVVGSTCVDGHKLNVEIELFSASLDETSSKDVYLMKHPKKGGFLEGTAHITI